MKNIHQPSELSKYLISSGSDKQGTTNSTNGGVGVSDDRPGRTTVATTLNRIPAARLDRQATPSDRPAGHLPALEPEAGAPPAESPALEAIRSLYYHPGPYVSINVTVHPGHGPAAESTSRRWAAIDLELQRRRTSPLVIEEIATRVLAKPPAWAASLSVIAASDGTVVAGHGPEPFFADMVVVDALPYVVPLLAWSQRRGPHLIMSDTMSDRLNTPSSGDATISTDDDHFIDSLERRRNARSATRLVLLGQPAATRPVADMIAAETGRRFQVVTETRLLDADQITSSRTKVVTGPDSETVHQSVAHLPGVDGDSTAVTTVLDRLKQRDVDVLVVPRDDTLDQRRVWVGPLSGELSLTRRRGYDHQARLVDAAIRAALVSGVSVVVQRGHDDEPRFAA